MSTLPTDLRPVPLTCGPFADPDHVSTEPYGALPPGPFADLVPDLAGPSWVDLVEHHGPAFLAGCALAGALALAVATFGA